ncbi:MAG: polysaccharide biosynthesis/export family protein [Ginsengibacter sp.]
MSKSFFFSFLCLMFIAMEISCTTSNKTAYLNNIRDTTFSNVNDQNLTFIQNNDILSISISSLSPEASSIFNTTNNAVSNTGNSSSNRNQSMGYMVGTDGLIQLPIIGNLKAAGLTKKQLKDNITSTLLSKKLLIDPIVDIRYLNYEVTVIGEVVHPTVITVPNERISLLKALGLAGDLTIYGKRENILLIRENNGVKTTRHIDINSSSFITSPYYYLQPNDVVYVEPNKAKAVSASLSRQLLPSVLSGLSLLVLILTRLNQ